MTPEETEGPLTFEEMEYGLTDPSANVRAAFAQREDYPFSPAQIKRGLIDNSPQVQLAFASNPSLKATPLEFNLYTNHTNHDVRASLYHCENIDLTEALIDKALKDGFFIRSTIAKRKNIKFNPQQIELMLSDPSPFVREAISARTDFTPTPAQIERGLTDYSCFDARIAFARRTDYTPTPAQIERGFQDPEHTIRIAFLSRADVTPTPAQFARGVSDHSFWPLQCAFIEHPTFLTWHTHVREAFLKRKDEWLSRNQIEKLKAEFIEHPTKPLRKTL